MKTQTVLIALAAFCFGCIAGIGTWALKRHTSAENLNVPDQIMAALPNEEAGKPTDWAEYRKGDWHVAAVWIQDAANGEARIYALRKAASGAWKLTESDKMSYSQDRLDHVVVNYPDRNVMLIDDKGLLIRTVLFGEGERLGLPKSASSNSEGVGP